jgi:hypothetical protein
MQAMLLAKAKELGVMFLDQDQYPSLWEEVFQHLHLCKYHQQQEVNS